MAKCDHHSEPHPDCPWCTTPSAVVSVPDPRVAPSLVVPKDLTANVIIRVLWRGLIHKVEKVITAEIADHYHVDRAVWDATVEIRRALVQQEYSNLKQDGGRGAGLRNEFEAFGGIRAYLHENPERRFELIPPGRGWDSWSAWFTLPNRPGEIDHNPPLGVGSTDRIAIENLLRFIEGRDVING